MDPTSISALVQRQRQLFNQGATRDLGFRLAQLRALRRAVIANEDRILQALKADMGRPEVEGYTGELLYILDEINHTIQHFRSWARVRRVATPLVHFRSSSQVYPEPLGVVLIISAWNYPFMQLFGPLAGAIAAGNCAVLKPSPVSTHCQRAIAEIVNAAFDPGLVAVVEGGLEAVQELLAQQFDHIMFTGSPATGRVVMEAAAQHLTPVTLELGGKSPAIVDRDADLELAARRVTWAKFFNAGQTCVAPDHLYVHRSVKGELVRRMQGYVTRFYGDDPARSPDLARINTQRSFDRLAGYLEEGEVTFGGRTDAAARYIAPTFLEDPAPGAAVMREEIFGPILPIIEFDDLAEVLAAVNAAPKPLSLYYFSRDRASQERVLGGTSSGGVTINDTMLHGSTMSLPFGGVGNSGMGAYHGKHTFDTFTHYKSVLRHGRLLDLDLRYPPYAGKLPRWRRLLRLLGYYGGRA
jgi:acyl-CoA reductase-like NAD-dependent aldehyde dehydrogenase